MLISDTPPPPPHSKHEVPRADRVGARQDCVLAPEPHEVLLLPPLIIGLSCRSGRSRSLGGS